MQVKLGIKFAKIENFVFLCNEEKVLSLLNVLKSISVQFAFCDRKLAIFEMNWVFT